MRQNGQSSSIADEQFLSMIRGIAESVPPYFRNFGNFGRVPLPEYLRCELHSDFFLPWQRLAP